MAICKAHYVEISNQRRWRQSPDGQLYSARHIKIAEQRTIISSTVIGTLAVDGWAVTFGTARRGLGGLQSRSVPSPCTKCNSPPTNSQCTNFVLFDVTL